jgi:hypothetical protein
VALLAPSWRSFYNRVKDFNTIDFRTKDFDTIIKIRIPFHYFDIIPRRAAFYMCLQNAPAAVHYLVVAVPL